MYRCGWFFFFWDQSGCGAVREGVEGGLFLRFLPLGGSAGGGGEFAFGHCASEATDVVL